MAWRSGFFLLALLCLNASSQAQTEEKPDSAQVVPTIDLERIMEDATQDAEDSQLLDRILQLQENPLDLNTAAEEGLQEIPGITPILAFNIVSYRELHRFETVEDLLRVEGITNEILQKVRRFLTVTRGGKTAELLSIKFRSRTAQDLQRRKGFQDGSYAGSPVKLYHRLTAKAGILSNETESSRQAASLTTAEVGVLTKKDAGERSAVDFMAGYISLAVPALKARLILGDYVIESAEGLVFWRSIAFSKGSEVISTVKKGGRGVRPYLSTDENWYFRGIATEVETGPMKISGFFSKKPLHASVNDAGVLTSFYTSGLFRTSGELSKRNAAGERLIGLRATGTPIRGLVVGTSLYRATFDHRATLADTFGFSGTSASVVGFDVSYTFEKSSVFAETARDQGKSMAGVVGLLLRPKTGIDIAILSRAYPREYNSLHGNGFGESGGPPQNETGTYIAARLRLASWISVSAYYDQYVFPWRTSAVKLPSHGNDMLALVETSLSRKLSLLLQFKQKKKDVSETLVDFFGRNRRLVGIRTQRNYRATVDLISSITFRWRSRVEWVEVNYDVSAASESGTLLFQDVQVIPASRLWMSVRIIGFQTGSFDSRLYEFEHDVQGTFSNPALFGKGIRWYIVTRYEASRSIDVSLKYSQTLKDGAKSISSGANEILGNLESKITLQLDVSI